MDTLTTRFGLLSIEAEDVIRFPNGLFGLEDCHHWVLLADTENSSLAWLQSLEHANVALAVVSPRRFIPTYRLHVSRLELAPLELGGLREAEVLLVVSKHKDLTTTLNLKAPLVINLVRRRGRQVIANGAVPVQYSINAKRLTWKKSA